MAMFDPMIHDVEAKYSLLQLDGEHRFMRISVLLYSGDLADADNLHLRYHCHLEVADDDVAQWNHDTGQLRVYDALQSPIVDQHLRNQKIDPLMIDILMDYLRSNFSMVANKIIEQRKDIYPQGVSLSREIIKALNSTLTSHNETIYSAPESSASLS